MTAARTVALGLLALAGVLAALLLTDGFGFGDDGRGGPSWPGVLEDDYDRQAYQQRGRWIASGGRPYLDEFSEYPQVTTWAMGLPYLLFDHGVVPGEPFSSKERLRALYARALDGARAEREAEKALRELTRTPFTEAAAAAPGSPVERRAAALANAAGVPVAEAREILADAWRESRALVDELKRNRKTYGDLHHVLMAVWLASLLVLSVALLRTLGEPPAWALLLLLPATLFFGFNRFDAVVTTMVAATLLLHLRGHERTAALVLGVAVMTKWFPVVLAPLLFRHAYERARAADPAAPRGEAFVRTWVVPGAIVGAVVVACLGVTYAWGGGGWDAVRFVFDWHAEVRRPNKSSLLVTLTSDAQWGLLDATARPTLEKVFKFLQLVPGAMLALLPLRTARAVILAALTATLLAVTFSEFFSPQWVVWTTALSLLVAPRWRRFAALTAALESLLWLQMFFHAHAYATRMLDEASNPTWAPFWAVHHVRTVVLLLFLAVAAGTLIAEVRARRDVGGGAG